MAHLRSITLVVVVVVVSLSQVTGQAAPVFSIYSMEAASRRLKCPAPLLQPRGISTQAASSSAYTATAPAFTDSPTTASHSDVSTYRARRPHACSASTQAAISWVRMSMRPGAHTAFSRSDHASRSASLRLDVSPIIFTGVAIEDSARRQMV